MTKIDWKINIEYLAAKVAKEYGVDSVAFIFARYDATNFEDLSPCFYEDVFGDLMQMDADS